MGWRSSPSRIKRGGEYDAFVRQYKKEPPKSMVEPPLLPQNRLLLDVYYMIADQYIFSFAGAVGLNIGTVSTVLKSVGVSEDDMLYYIGKIRLIQHKLNPIKISKKKKKK